MHVNVSDENAAKLQREIDVNGDGIVSIPEVTDWWKKKQEKMNEKLYKDPTAEWGNAPGTTSREVMSKKMTFTSGLNYTSVMHMQLKVEPLINVFFARSLVIGGCLRAFLNLHVFVL